MWKICSTFAPDLGMNSHSTHPILRYFNKFYAIRFTKTRAYDAR